MTTTSLLPPQYVNLSAAVTYTDDLSAPHFRTYARLVGLAWRDQEHTRLPPLSLADLAALCHLRPRAMRLHLQALARKGLLNITGDCHAYQLHVREPAAPGSADAHFTTPLMPQPEHSPEAPPPPATAPSAAVRENLQVLAEFGVRPQVQAAQQAAALSHVTPTLIRSWGRELQQRASVRNLPGLLLYQLSTTRHSPQPEHRGGARVETAPRPSAPLLPVPPPASPDQPSLPPLPAEIRTGLHALGWSGPTGEVERAHAQTPQRVQALLHYWQTQNDPTIKSRAALFRAALRAGSWPPPKPDEGGHRYISGKYAEFIQH